MTNQPLSGAAPAAPTPEQISQLQMQAYLTAPVPKIYANGLGMNASSNDVTIVLINHAMPAAIVSMSYTTAKSLSEEINKAISHWETISGDKIKSMTELAILSAKPKK